MALEAGAAGARGLTVLDAGAGTGFTTEGIVARVDAPHVTMLDQSPHQLARSRAKPALRPARACSATPRRCPFADDSSTATSPPARSSTGRTRSAGIAEAYRVTRAGGTALMIGPVRPANRVARALAETWMLFPPGRRLHALDGGRRVHGRAGAPSSRRTGTATSARRTRWP